MSTELEQLLTRELHQVAADVRVPTMPPLVEAAPTARPSYRWLPLLAAAVVVAIIATAMLATRDTQSRRGTGPAHSPTRSPQAVSTATPTTPYITSGRLYVDGRRVPGAWDSVQSRGRAWAGIRTDGTAWWGTDPEPMRVDGSVESMQLSPDGKLLAVQRTAGGPGLAVSETRRGGEGVGTLDLKAGDEAGLSAITADALVVIGHVGRAELWNARTGQRIDLSRTAPGQQFWGVTQAGLTWQDTRTKREYVGTVDAAGRITRGRTLPPDPVSPGPLVLGPHALRSVGLADPPRAVPAGQIYPHASVRDLRTGATARLTAPAGWGFTTFTWEDDDLFLSPVVDGQARMRMARCSAELRQCVLTRPGR